MEPRNENQEMKITVKKEMIWRNENKVQKEMKRIVLPISTACNAKASRDATSTSAKQSIRLSRDCHGF